MHFTCVYFTKRKMDNPVCMMWNLAYFYSHSLFFISCTDFTSSNRLFLALLSCISYPFFSRRFKIRNFSIDRDLKSAKSGDHWFRRKVKEKTENKKQKNKNKNKKREIKKNLFCWKWKKLKQIPADKIEKKTWRRKSWILWIHAELSSLEKNESSLLFVFYVLLLATICGKWVFQVHRMSIKVT